MNKIVDAINANIEEALKDRQPYMLVNGIAEAAVVRGDEEIAMPAIVSADGECNTDLFNDEYDFGIYHRLTGISYSTDYTGGYGDVAATVRTATMSAVVYGKRKFIPADALEQIICKAIVDASDGKRTVLSVQNSEFDRLTVFASEFTGLQFFMQPDIFLFKVNYQIETSRAKCE